MALTLTNASLTYPGAHAPALADITAELAPGRVTAIVGPNGSGKSTLVRLLAGLLAPTNGSVRIAGADPAHLDERARARRLAYIPQRSSPAFDFTAHEVAAFGGLAATRAAAGRAADHALQRVGLADRADTPVAHLSVGQQQRVTLARALAQLDLAPDPVALLADEPTSAMDPRHALETLTTLNDLAEHGLAVALVIHDLTLAARHAHDTLVLDARGRLAAFGPAPETLTPAILDPVFDVAFHELEDAGGRALIPNPAPSR